MKSTTPEAKIRDARSSELEEVSKLLVASYLQYKEFMPSEGWDWYSNDMADVRGRMADSTLIVAEVDNQIVGAVTLYLRGSALGWPEGWAGVRLLAVPT